MRATARPVKGSDGRFKAVVLREIDPEPFTGPEVIAKQRIVENGAPPVHSPLRRALEISPLFAEDARQIRSNLSGRNRPRVFIRSAVLPQSSDEE